MNKHFLIFAIMFLLGFSDSSIAGTITDKKIDFLYSDGIDYRIEIDLIIYQTDNKNFQEILWQMSDKNQSFSFIYDDGTLDIQSITLSSDSNDITAFSSIVSFLIGGISCMAFALGVNLKYA